MTKNKKTKKVKKNKKTKKIVIDFKKKYESFLGKLQAVLGIRESGNFDGFFSIGVPMNSEETVLNHLVGLRDNHSREDEGTKLEAENKKNLMEVIRMITGDDARIKSEKNIKVIEEDF